MKNDKHVRNAAGTRGADGFIRGRADVMMETGEIDAQGRKVEKKVADALIGPGWRGSLEARVQPLPNTEDWGWRAFDKDYEVELALFSAVRISVADK